jgi:tripartite-type tricarboxylate transporter receptor subunit TctC
MNRFTFGEKFLCDTGGAIMQISRRRFLALAPAAALAARSRSARADGYPSRPVHIIVGLAAGGPTDVAARFLADWLSQHFGQQFVVENRTGMGGNLAAQAMIAAPPDGYTLHFAGPTLTIGPSLYRKLPFDIVRDAAGVAAMMRLPDLMVVPASLPVKTVQDFIDYAKANPGKLSMASSGVGATPHLAGELFKSTTGIEMVHVPYRGSSAVYPDLVSGRVHVLFDNVGGPVLSLIGDGKLRALGETALTRWPSLPDLPAVAETVPGFEVIVWYGLFAPRATPPDVIATLNHAVNASLTDPTMCARIADGGGEPMPMSPAALDAFVRADLAKWRQVIETAHISAE